MRYVLLALLVACSSPAVETAPPGDTCDEDGDGFEAAACGGDDCCDSDPSARPGQTAWSDEPTGCGGFDFDCDGVETPRDVQVETCTMTAYDECTEAGEIGWTGTVPACGEPGDFAAGCARETTQQTCEPADVAERVQMCR